MNIIRIYIIDTYTFTYYYILVSYLYMFGNRDEMKSFFAVLILYEQNFNRLLTESRQSGMYNRILFEYYIIFISITIIIIITLLLYATDIKIRLTRTRYQLCNLQLFCYRRRSNRI